jgi:hypothetical protein
MAFRKTNNKKKVTKKKTNNKRRVTKKKTNNKRRVTSRKSKKYGGKFTNILSMGKLINIIRTPPDIPYHTALAIVTVMEENPHIYDIDNIINQLKTAINNGIANGNYNKAKIISETLYKIHQNLDTPQQASQPIQPPQNNPPINDCICQDKEPVDCTVKKDYIDQARIFHPDKNRGCVELANKKFQELENKPSCINVKKMSIF